MEKKGDWLRFLLKQCPCKGQNNKDTEWHRHRKSFFKGQQVHKAYLSDCNKWGNSRKATSLWWVQMKQNVSCEHARAVVETNAVHSARWQKHLISSRCWKYQEGADLFIVILSCINPPLCVPYCK